VKKVELWRCLNDDESREEQSIMNRLNHKNVLQLIGFYDKGDSR
jgi:hypothetical protein